jgi:arsenical pump membrane protein
VLALLALALTLVAAIGRRRHLPEWLAALLGAGLLLAVGATSWHAARSALGDLGSTVGFLAALLVLAEGCRRQGVFDTLGAWLARGSDGQPARLLGLVFVASTVVTVVLGLDATVVLLTPIALLTAAQVRADPKPGVYACAHLANSASLLLPVSNLTNLLAFRASRVSFIHFGVLMTLPWLVALAVEWAVFRRAFAAQLRPAQSLAASPPPPVARRPATAGTRFALAVLGLTLFLFSISSVLDVAPVWIAVGGAVVMVLPTLPGERPVEAARDLVRAAAPGFLVFVFGLGVIVRAAADHGLRSAVVSLLPAGGTLPDLILVAAISAVAANLLNNLPATLILVPVAGGFGLGPLLAVLVGVNLGPNLTYGGSLATLLWRRIVHPDAVRVELSEFTRIGLATVLPGIPLVAAAVWVSVRLLA